MKKIKGKFNKEPLIKEIRDKSPRVDECSHPDSTAPEGPSKNKPKFKNSKIYLIRMTNAKGTEY